MALELRAMRADEVLAGVFVEGEGGVVAVVNRGERRSRGRRRRRAACRWRRGGRAPWAARCRAGVDEVADIGVARGDDAVEGSVDFLEGLELLEAADVGFGGVDGGLLGGCVAHGHVGLLLGDGVGFEEVLIALRGGVGEIEVGLRALEIGLRDLQLLVELGGFDDGHQLALATWRRCRRTSS